MIKLFKVKDKKCNDNLKDGCVNRILYNHFQKQFEKLVEKMNSASIKVFEAYVIKGEKKDGIFLSFPTVNTEIKYDGIKRISNGFMLSKTTIKNHSYNSVSFINKKTNIIKTHILNFNGDIYGEKIKIKILQQLHPISNQELLSENKISGLFIKSIEEACQITNTDNNLF